MSHECEHDFTEYYDCGQCGTYYCEWSESHCRKCHRFIVRCGCGFETGDDGWPRHRRMKWHRIQEAKARAAGVAARDRARMAEQAPDRDTPETEADRPGPQDVTP